LHQYRHYKSPKLTPSQIKKLKGYLFFLFSIAFFFLVYSYIEKQIMPTIIARSQIQGKIVATEMMNESIIRAMSKKEMSMEELVYYDYNNEGELISWDVNTVLMNEICSDIITYTMEGLKKLEKMIFKIPFGQLAGSHLFANVGPKISMSIFPLGVVSADYKNQMVAAGINQVNHTVWIEVRANIGIVIPLLQENIEVVRRVVLVDKVMAGKVPSSYIYIPETNIEGVIPKFIEGGE
jgi:sporulation protein YunB